MRFRFLVRLGMLFFRFLEVGAGLVPAISVRPQNQLTQIGNLLKN